LFRDIDNEKEKSKSSKKEAKSRAKKVEDEERKRVKRMKLVDDFKRHLDNESDEEDDTSNSSKSGALFRSSNNSDIATSEYLDVPNNVLDPTMSTQLSLNYSHEKDSETKNPSKVNQESSEETSSHDSMFGIIPTKVCNLKLFENFNYNNTDFRS